MCQKKLSDIYNSLNLFDFFYDNISDPVIGKISAIMQDIGETGSKSADLYIKFNYGDRLLSPLGEYSEKNVLDTARVIVTLHGDNWNRLHKLFTEEYDPLWNVDGSETTTVTNDLKRTTSVTSNKKDGGKDTIEGTNNSTNTESISSTLEQSGSDKVDGSSNEKVTSNNTTESSSTTHNAGSESKKANVYGFDIVTATPDRAPDRAESNSSSADVATSGNGTETGSNTTEGTNSSTTTYGKKDKTTGTNTNTIDGSTSSTTTYGHTEEGENNGTESNTGTITTAIKRGGNIGITSSQSLFEQELALRKKTKFINLLIADVVDELTLCVY